LSRDAAQSKDGHRALRQSKSMKERVVFCWSGGKDSALALYKVLQSDAYEVVALLTTCNEHFQRVSMHGVRIGLARRQAAEIGLPLDIIYLSEHASNDEYESKMFEYLSCRRSQGVSAVVFGDIFLEDLRQWREASLAKIGLRGIFPLWRRDTKALIDEFLSLGFGSVLCCVSDAYFGESDVGTILDEPFIDRLPAGVDPCGENGEFHSFAFKGPIFSAAIPLTLGTKVYRAIPSPELNATCPLPEPNRSPRGFWFCDILEA
jgi:uncharacterized protein (TIGR00290 family)